MEGEITPLNGDLLKNAGSQLLYINWNINLTIKVAGVDRRAKCQQKRIPESLREGFHTLHFVQATTFDQHDVDFSSKVRWHNLGSRAVQSDFANCAERCRFCFNMNEKLIDYDRFRGRCKNNRNAGSIGVAELNLCMTKNAQQSGGDV